MLATSKCPYCGHENKIVVKENDFYQRQIVTCELNEGGCDKDYVADVKIRVEVSGKKIEGEAE